MKKLICVAVMLWAGVAFGASQTSGSAQTAPGPGPGPGPGVGSGGVFVEDVICPALPIRTYDRDVTVIMSGKKYVVKLLSINYCWWEVKDKDGKRFWLNIANADAIYEEEK